MKKAFLILLFLLLLAGNLASCGKDSEPIESIIPTLEPTQTPAPEPTPTPEPMTPIPESEPAPEPTL